MPCNDRPRTGARVAALAAPLLVTVLFLVSGTALASHDRQRSYSGTWTTEFPDSPGVTGTISFRWVSADEGRAAMLALNADVTELCPADRQHYVGTYTVDTDTGTTAACERLPSLYGRYRTGDGRIGEYSIQHGTTAQVSWGGSYTFPARCIGRCTWEWFGVFARHFAGDGARGCAALALALFRAPTQPGTCPAPAGLKCGGKQATLLAQENPVSPVNQVVGTAKNDVIVGTNDEDLILGGGGRDVICALGGDDVVNGGGRVDLLYGGAGDDALNGGVGDFDDGLYGGSGDDVLRGGVGDDYLLGGADDDTLHGGFPSDDDIALGDHVIGGAGNDRLVSVDPETDADYRASPRGIRVSLGRGVIVGEGTDRVDGPFGIYGSRFADTIVGNARPNYLDGGGGNDTLTGGAGRDGFDGGPGRDEIDGGAGFDGADGGPGADRCVDVERFVNC